MKILLINNQTRHLDSLSKSLAGHNIEVQTYKPGLSFHVQNKDLIVLSGGGGEGLEIHDTYEKGKLWYDDQMKFVRDCTTPIVGICMGFEVICRLFGSEIKKLPHEVEGFKQLQATARGRQSFSRAKFKQFESHEWGVDHVDTKQFNILAESRNGVELIKHKKRSLIASQFHPEINGGTLNMQKLLTILSV